MIGHDIAPAGAVQYHFLFHGNMIHQIEQLAFR